MVDGCAIRGDFSNLKKKKQAKKYARCGVLNSDVQYIKKVLVFPMSKSYWISMFFMGDINIYRIVNIPL